MAERSKEEIGRGSKRKGNSFENRVAKLIREHFGVDAKTVYRTPLSGGHYERGDLIVKPPLLRWFPVFFECRDRMSWSWQAFFKKQDNYELAQWYLIDAKDKCHPGDGGVERMPVLVFHKNHEQIWVIFAWEDVAKFATSSVATIHSINKLFPLHIQLMTEEAGVLVCAPFIKFLELFDIHGDSDESSLAA